ncbi:MAG: hypothetical protein KC766_08645 [Myxococcales bacterium]|nr:hypothetical protein [Myxococcales bacterium]
MRRWLKRALVTVSLGSALSVGLIGFAHTEAGRPLLGWMKGAPGCPMIEGDASPESIEAYRTRTLQKQLVHASEEAHLTPALDLSLGKSTRVDVKRFATRQGGRCEDTAKQAALRCVGFAASSRLSDVYAQFDPEGRLVALDSFSDLTAEAAIAYFAARRSELERKVGPVTKISGVSPSTAQLATPYARSAVEFEYKRYSAKLSVMNFGKRGTRVRQQYQWLAPSEVAAR